MYGLDNNSGVSVMPAIAPTTSPIPLWFTEGGANQSPSYPGEGWFNMMQGELLNVVAESGLTPNKADLKQVAAAIKVMIANSAYTVPVGVPLPWPTAVAPSGWLKCNGATFDKAKYPLLATVYPSGVLPDLRGEFIRGWDDGRGVDTGRGLLSSQIGSKLRTCASTTTGSAGNGANIWHNAEFDQIETITLYSVATNAAGLPFQVGIVRPRNIAFNYIVRAA